MVRISPPLNIPVPACRVTDPSERISAPPPRFISAVVARLSNGVAALIPCSDRLIGPETVIVPPEEVETMDSAITLAEVVRLRLEVITMFPSLAPAPTACVNVISPPVPARVLISQKVPSEFARPSPSRAFENIIFAPVAVTPPFVVSTSLSPVRITAEVNPTAFPAVTIFPFRRTCPRLPDRN